MTENTHKIFVTTGASNHTETVRASYDLYTTDPKALEKLLEKRAFNHHIWECAAGQGHLSEVLKKHGYKVYSTDLNDYGYKGLNAKVNFLSNEVLPQADEGLLHCDILTNPPYTKALEFIKQALNVIEKGYNVVMFLRIQFLEGKARRFFFDKNPPKEIYVFSERIKCTNQSDPDALKSSAICYAWFVWEKGFKGDPIIKWL